MPAMTEMQPAKTAGYVDRGYNHTKKQKRLEEEEKEIARLEALARGEEVEEEEEVEEPQQEVQVQAEEPEPTDPEEKSFKKRYGDLRRHMAEKEKEWEQKFESLKNQTQNKPVVPPKSDEDIAEWARKYPDVAGIVETIAQKKAADMVAEFRERFEKLDEIEKETTRKTAEQQIREAHNDFDELRKDDAFHDWAAEQPKWVQDALYENEDDASSVIRVIDLYKMDKGLTSAAKRQKTRAAASMVKSNSKASIDPTEGGKKFYESQVAKMSPKEYEASEEKIMEAIRKGNFVYDLSGGAR